MAFVEWSDSLSVGNDTIDGQHKKLIELVNKLHQAMASGHGKEIITGVFDEMIAYTEYHFKTEEKAFDKYGYDRIDEHKEQHREFVEKVGDLKKKYAGGELLITIETLKFLVDWISNHIKKADQLYMPLLKGREV